MHFFQYTQMDFKIGNYGMLTDRTSGGNSDGTLLGRRSDHKQGCDLFKFNAITYKTTNISNRYDIFIEILNILYR